jgi:hypothetical protein
MLGYGINHSPVELAGHGSIVGSCIGQPSCDNIAPFSITPFSIFISVIPIRSALL